MDEGKEVTGEFLVDLIYNSIAESMGKENFEEMKEAIGYIDFDMFGTEDLNQTMVCFIMMAYNWKIPGAVNHIFEAFDANNPVVDARPSSTTFYTISSPALTDEVYKFVAAANTEPSSNCAWHFFKLLDYGAEPGTNHAMEKLIIAYGEQSLSFYDDIYDAIQKRDVMTGFINAEVAAFCLRKIKELSDVVEKPSYLIPSPYTDKELEVRASKIRAPVAMTPSVTNSTNMIMKDLEIRGSVFEREKETVYNNVFSDLSRMSREDYTKKMLRYVETLNQADLQTNTELFKIYGPSFPEMGMSALAANSSDVCLKFGGCRMLLCVGHTPRTDLEDVGEGDDSPDWFTGYCRWCNGKIAARHHAIRLPLPYGGWDTDSYCSRKCAKYDIMEPDYIQEKLLDRLVDKIDAIGIYDRTYEKEKAIKDDVISVAPGYFEYLAGFPVKQVEF
jgi:hypothetical protein